MCRNPSQQFVIRTATIKGLGSSQPAGRSLSRYSPTHRTTEFQPEPFLMVESSALLRKIADYNQSSIQWHLQAVCFEGKLVIRYLNSIICSLVRPEVCTNTNVTFYMLLNFKCSLNRKPSLLSSCSDAKEISGAEASGETVAAAAAAAACVSSPVPDAASASSSSTQAPNSSPGAAKEAPSSPKLVVEIDGASQMSGSGCTSQASVDDEDDVPITDIYFVSYRHTFAHPFTHIDF